MDFKKLLLIFIGFLCVIANANGQLVGTGHSTTRPTVYTNGTTNDVIYIYCSSGNTLATGSLTATPNGGTGPYTYSWFSYNSATNGWTPMSTTTTPTINGLANGGYFVSIVDGAGVSRGCFRAWVFINETSVDAGNTITACGNFTLNGTANPETNFVYYNPPPNPLTVNNASVINVCFSATHTYVSDLAFYLIGPVECGSPRINLSPNPGALGQNNICNGGNDVVNLCFSNTSTANLNVCTSGAPLTGTYGTYGLVPTPIDWAPLNGCPATSGGWAVQIYDCIAGDVGAFTNSTISINGNSTCGPINATYNSGTINSAIDDNSCTAALASIYSVPASPATTTPITLTNTITSVSWSHGATTLNPTVNPAPAASQWYYLTVTDNFGCTKRDSVQYINSCVCAFTFMSRIVGSCYGNSLFDLSGSLQFQYPPTTGQLIVEDCNGNSSTYNAPFTSPMNFAINGINATGENCNVTAYFTATPACTISLDYQNRTPCVCNAEIGTFTTATQGNSNSTYVLCYGDEVLITSNGDNVDPDEALFPPYEEGYNPGIGWLVYSCPPTVGLTYQDDEDVAADPCNLGVLTGEDFYDQNDMYWINAYPPGTFTNNVVYFVPITFYNVDENLYTYTNGTLPCYEMGTPYAVQYLPQITRTIASNCQAGTVTVTVQGGAPAVNGSQFTASNLLPANASFVNNTTANGGTIVVQGLTNGQNYSFTIQDQYDCPITITGTFQGVTASGFSYAQAAYCKGSVNPSPVLTGVAGGTYSGTTGLVINAISGVVNIAATPVGTYTVTYTSPGAPCNSQSTFVITINPLPVVTAPNVAVCNGTVANLVASGANTYTWAPATGLNTTTGANVTATLTANQTYTITGTSTQGCVGTGTVSVTVNANPVPVITGPTQHCQGTPATLQTTQTFTTYNWTTGVTTATTQATAANSPITVTVTNAQGCTGTSAAHVLTQNPVFNTSSSVTICQGQTAMIHGVARSTAGNYTFNGQSIRGCDSTSVVTLIVNPLPVINAGANQVVCDGASVVLNATGNGTIVWTPAMTNNVPFVQPIGTQTYTATSTDVNGCVNTSTTTVTVNPNPTPVITGQVEYCASSPATVQTTQTYTTYSWTTGSTNQSTQATVVNNPIQVTVTNAFGCTGTSTAYNVIENVLITTNGSVEICSGQSAVIHGITRTVAGVYTNVSPSATGCDSTSNITLIVHALPVLTHTANQVVCDGTPVTLTAQGAPTLVWAPVIGNGVAFTQPVGTQIYGLTGTSAQGCVSTSQVTVTVNPNPVPVISAPAAYCAGETVTVQANQVFTTYNWTTGATTATTQATIANNPIQVTVTNGFGCSAVSNAINLLQNPVLNTTGTVTICQGQSAVIHGQVQTTAGAYSNTALSAMGCDSTSVITLIVNPLPVLAINNVPDACDGEPVTLFATGAPTLVWSPLQTNGVEFLQAVGTQVYTVTGTDANGCVNTAQTQIVVKPLPIITAVQNQIVCNNALSPVINFASNLTGTTYSWLNDTPSIGLPSVGNGNIASFTALNTGTTPIVATITVIPTTNACDGNPITFTITVQPSPQATIAGSTEVCFGAAQPQITFTGAIGVAPYTFTYNINGGPNSTVISNGNTATINAPTSVAGTFVYNLVGVVEGSENCLSPATGNVTIEIFALPNVSAGADASVCQNLPITLTATGAETFVWTPALINNTPFVPVVGGVYSVVGTDANGCQNTDNLILTINPAVIVDAGPNIEICIGESVSLNAISTDQQAIFVWSNGVVNNVPFNPVTTATYTVSSTDVNGCIGIDQTTVIVHALPNVEAGNTVYGCSSDLIVLTGAGAGPTGQYVWDNNVVDGVPFNPNPSVIVYHLTGTDENGCVNTDSVMSKVEAIPTVSFTVDVDNNCVPVIATFTNTTTDEHVNCIWNFDDGSTVNGCGPINHVFNYAGSFGASLQVQTPINGCIGTLYMQDLVTVDPMPVAHFTPNPPIGTQVSNQITFNNESYGASYYSWTFGDGVGVSSETDPVYTYGDKVDMYEVMLIATSNAGCIDTAYSIVQIKEELIFYVPNTFTPDQDQFNEMFSPVFTYGYDPYDYSLFIYNRWGEMVFESHDATIGWSGRYGVDGKLCQEGAYTWKIEVKTSMSDERKMFVGHVNLLR